MDRSSEAAYQTAKHTLIAHEQGEFQTLNALRDHALRLAEHASVSAEDRKKWKSFAKDMDRLLSKYASLL